MFFNPNAEPISETPNYGDQPELVLEAVQPKPAQAEASPELAPAQDKGCAFTRGY